MNAFAPVENEPHDAEAEQSLLGALLFDNRQIDRCDITADDFYVAAHGCIFDAIVTAARAGEAAPSTVLPLIQGDERLSGVAAKDYLTRLVQLLPAARLAPQWVSRIRDLSRKRRILYACQDAIEGLSNPESADTQLEALESSLFALADRQASASVMSLGQALDAMLREAEQQSTGEVIPVDTGLRDLDDKLDGLMPGDLTVGAARPGVGKTALATGIAMHNAWKGRPVGMFQLEMRGQQVAARVLAERLGIPAKPIMRGKLRYEQWQDAETERAKLHKLPLYIDARPGVPLDQFIPRARRMKRQHGIELLIVDYLGLIRVPGVSSYERVTQVSQMMKELARDLDIHVLALHQLNRGNEKEARRPSMADLRDSGAVEQDADNILLIHREEMSLAKAEPDPGDGEKHAKWAQRLAASRGQAEIIVDKQRNGSTGTVLLRFDARTTTFSDGEP